MLSRLQQILIKRAQAEAGLNDEEYRDLLEELTGCRTSKDPRLGDRQLDVVLALFEAICWRGRDGGILPAPNARSAFRNRGYWAAKNRSGETSRDRFVSERVKADCSDLEEALQKLGFGDRYCASIRIKVSGHDQSTSGMIRYRAALRRTLKFKMGGDVHADCI